MMRLSCSVLSIMLAIAGALGFVGLSQSAIPAVPTSAPVVVDVIDCPPTPQDALGPAYAPGAPERSLVGTGGYVVRGVVRDSSACQPVPGAQIEFWLVNETGEYDDTHRGTVFTDGQGVYRFESNRPIAYGGGAAHIHMRVTAPGFRELVTLILPDDIGTANEVDVPLNLTPGP
ncbi:MAG: intradiol ring-cleavage dioxygenase [Anaerolineae bacterium]|nr:intradiol ring-cleavage dioxygenase [Anaerolineae bacterium]